MEKKIIAISLVVVLMLTVFVGCGKKYDYSMEEIGGRFYPVVLDEDGNNVVNEAGKISVYVLEDGKVKKEKGEPVTYWVEVEDVVVGKNEITNGHSSMKAIDGWSVDEKGLLVKNGTDGKCYINGGEVGEINKNTPSLKDYIIAQEETNKIVVDVFESSGYTMEVVNGEKCTITSKGLVCEVVKYIAKDKNGKIVHYTEAYYFTKNEKIYKLEYVCLEGLGYDETFSFKSYLDENYVYSK